MTRFEKAPFKITDDMRRALRQMAAGEFTNQLQESNVQLADLFAFTRRGNAVNHSSK